MRRCFMKKNCSIHGVIFFLISVLFFSCDFFTTNLAVNARRNLKDNFSKINTSDLANLITDPSMISDEDASRQLLEELGNRNDLSSLSSEQQSTVLDLLVSTSITSNTAADVLEAIKEASESENPDGEAIINEILNSISSSDVSAVTQILEDTDNLDNLNTKSICLSAICIVAQVAKTENVIDQIDEIKNNISSVYQNENPNIDNIVDTIIPSGSDESKAALNAALNAVNHLKNNDEEILLGFSVSDLFGALSASN